MKQLELDNNTQARTLLSEFKKRHKIYTELELCIFIVQEIKKVR